MKFRDFKRFDGSTLEAALSWLKNELNSVMRELFIGLNKLRFQDNFGSFEWAGILEATQELQIPHPFKETPTGYIIYKQVGNGVIDAGITGWTNQFVYLRNHGLVDVEVTVIFFV